MELIQTTALQVKCPHCGNKFNPEESIGHDMRVQLEYEFEKKMIENSKRIEDRIRKQEAERFAAQMKLVDDDRKAKATRLRELESSALALQQKERELVEREQRQELEMKRRLLDREKLLKDELEVNVREKIKLEYYEREQKFNREREHNE